MRNTRWAVCCMFAMVLSSPTIARAAWDTLLVARRTPAGAPEPMDSIRLTPSVAVCTINQYPPRGAELVFRSGIDLWRARGLAGRQERLANAVYGPARFVGSAADSLPSFRHSGFEPNANDGESYFDVRQVTYGTDDRVVALKMFFDSDCSTGGRVEGEVRFNADTTLRISAPVRTRARRGTSLVFDVGVTHAQAVPVTLIAVGLPAGATFTSLGPGLGRLAWTPSAAQQGRHVLNFWADDGGQHSETAHTLVQVDGDTLVAIVSEPGDRMFPGRSCRLQAHEMTLTGTTNDLLIGYSLSVLPKIPAPGPWFFSIGNASSQGGSNPPGNYTVLRRWSDPSYSAGDIIVSPVPSGACTKAETSFRIRRAEVGALPGQPKLRSFWLEWEQHCMGESPSFRGEMRLNAGKPVVMYAPIARRVQPAETLRFDVNARDTLGRELTLFTGPLPAGATFQVTGPNSGAFEWTPQGSSLGPRILTFMASAADGTADTVVTDVLVSGEFAARIESEPGDPEGGGVTLDHDGGPGAMLSTAIRYDGGYDRDVLELASAPGTYRIETPHSGPDLGNVGRYVLPWPAFSGINGWWFRCYGPGGGAQSATRTVDLRVRQLERAPNQQMTKVWLEFEQRSDDLMPILLGEVRWNTTWRVMSRAPLRRSVSAGQTLRFEVTAMTPDGEIPQVSALDLPAGAQFMPSGQGSGWFEWTPGPSLAFQERLVRFVALRADGTADTAATTLEVLPVATLHLVEGQTELHLTEALGQFRTHTLQGTASVRFSSPTADTSWSIYLLDSGADSVSPGPHVIGGFQGDDLCVDRFATSVFDPCWSDSGFYDVHRVVRGPDGAFRELWLSFEDRRWELPAPRTGWLELGVPGLVSVSPPEPGPPLTFAFRGVFPHPVVRGSRIALDLPGLGSVHAAAFDILGRRQWEHRWPSLPGGRHDLTTPGLERLGPGIYFLHLRHADREVSKRIIVVR